MTPAATPFARRVAGVFVTRLLQFASTIAVAFLLARLLGPEGRGAYSLVLLLPSTLFALAQLGLPSAVTYFAGSGRSMRSLVVIAVASTVALTALLVPVALAVLPALEEGVFQAAPADLLRLALLALPIQLGASLFGSILWGRQLVRRYTLILAAQSIGSLVMVIVLVGMAGLGVFGALLGYLLVTGASAAAVILTVRRSGLAEEAEPVQRPPARPRELLGYGLRLYPASLTTFLSYRSDLFLLGLLLGDAGAIGLYTLAVSLAEIVFHVPDAIATILYPRVAGAQREEADRIAPSISRFSLLVTILAAAALIPTAIVAVLVILPDFAGSIDPFLVLVPGTIALSVSKVVSGYVSGLGRPLPVGIIAIVALVANIVLNLVLIPPLGITGAALASLISYGAHALMMSAVASRLAHTSMGAFLLPGRAEAGLLVGRLRDLARGVRAGAARAGR
ncbi:MAG TPA: polysaccharide biosynthesis C-terminal domain-containing protein [Candidatus Limnocylindria bacterium]